MPFDLTLWKSQLTENLQDWKTRMTRAGVNSVYAFIAAAALYPVAQAAQQGDWSGLVALGGVTASIGTNLLANQIQNWRDANVAAKDLDAQVESNAALRSELDAVLEKLDAFRIADNALSASDRVWFQETLTRELARLGSHIAYNSQNITGDHNVAVQGDDNDLVVVHGNVLGSIYKIYRAPAGAPALSDQAFEKILGEYLRWVRQAYSKARLYGLESAPTARSHAKRELSDVFVPLTLRRFQPPRRDEIEALAEQDRGDMARERAFLKLVEQQHGEGQEIAVADLLTLAPNLAVIGGAGSGKSTLLTYLAAELAHSARTGAPPPFALPQNVRALVPLLIPLRYLREYMQLCQTSPSLRLSDPRAGTLAGFIAWYLKGRSALLEASADFFDRLLRGGGCLLMLDGLDEVVSRAERGRVRQQVEDLITDSYPGNRVIVTARESGYRENAVFGDDFVRLDVQRLSDAQIGALVQNWCTLLYPDDAAARANELTTAIETINNLRADRDLPPLVSTPLMTTMVVSVKWGEAELPRERARLYEACVKVILQAQYLREDTARQELVEWGGAWEEQREWLAWLALAMQRSGRAGAAVSEQFVRDTLTSIVAPDALDQFLQAVRLRGGLFEERAELFQFVHLTFQEFLAARLLAKERQTAFAQIRQVIAEPWWRETLLLTYGFAQMDHPPFARQYLDWLSGLDGDAHLAGVELAGAALLELEKPQPEARTRQARRLADSLFAVPQDAPVRVRARAGDTLARLEDPRAGVLTCAQMEFCFVPQGAFRMGSDKTRDAGADDDEQPAHTLALPAFWLARFPVTVAQWNEFVVQSGHKPADEDSLRGLANHPVWYVTWHEALAFCKWLNENWSAHLPQGYRLRLPSEAEWEKAARGGIEIPGAPSMQTLKNGLALSGALPMNPNPMPERIYPWGDWFDADKANVNGTKIGTTNSVGIFRVGASVYGCEELSGNVWEWTRSLYDFKYPYVPSDGRENLKASDNDARVVRGGSFLDIDWNPRCALRLRVFPGDLYYYPGFRVVASPFDSEFP